jgi:Lipopolysaccharide kinase (Kdo/WaaP) family
MTPAPLPPLPLNQIGSLWSRWTRGYRKVRQADDWESIAGADWLATLMDVTLTDDFHAKQGRSTGKWTLTAPDGRTLSVYLKRHFVLPRFDGLRAVLFPRRAWSPGMQEWEHITWAHKQGLPVPRPVAAGEFLQPYGRLQSFLVVEELTGQLALHQAVPKAAESLPAAEFRRWKHRLRKELVRLSLAFHGKSAFHKDWYFCHFYIGEADTRRVPETWRDRVTVIDLHRLARHPLTSWWRRVKDLAQLLYSSDVPGISERDRLGFWAGYRRHVPCAGLIARLARMKWRLYVRHNAPKG